MDHPAPQFRISDAERHRVAEVLREAAADGRLTLEELEERLGQAYAARTYADVEPIVADLPNTEGVLALPDGAASSPAPRSGNALVSGTPTGPSLSIAIFGGSKRGGRWVVPPSYQAFAMYGGVELDLRHATFAEPETTIYANCMFGGVVITVPDDVVVHVSGLPLFGGYGESEKEELELPPPGAPVLHVKGCAVFGGVDVQRRRRTRPGPPREAT